jgi:hypothetical protein
MTQQERLKKLFEENADFYEDDKLTKPSIDCDTFVRVASELLEEREKKTDIERCLDFYRSIGIECKVNICPKDGIFAHINKYEKYIVLSDGSGMNNETSDNRFNGYGMYSDIVFDKDGNFKSQGFWE